MRIPRLFLDLPLQVGASVALDGAPLHYIARVLRLRTGDELVVFNGEGGEFKAQVNALEKRSAALTLREFDAVSRASTLPLTLALGVSKGDRMDFAIQKSTELGVHAIQPLLTERSVVTFRDTERASKRVEHWQQIARSACEQCERNDVPVIAPPVEFSVWLTQWSANDGQLGLLLARNAAQPLPALPRPSGAVFLLIGPEGGLSAAEQGGAVAAGFTGLSLGPRTLRTETAAITAVAALQLQWGDLMH